MANARRPSIDIDKVSEGERKVERMREEWRHVQCGHGLCEECCKADEDENDGVDGD